jgi:hypothetical protein
MSPFFQLKSQCCVSTIIVKTKSFIKLKKKILIHVMWTALLTKINHCYSPNHQTTYITFFFLKIELLHSKNYCLIIFENAPSANTLCDYHNMVLYIPIRFNDTRYQMQYIKSQHLTSGTRISPSCSDVNVGISWINLKDWCTWSGPKMCWLYHCRKTMGHFMIGSEQPAA